MANSLIYIYANLQFLTFMGPLSVTVVFLCFLQKRPSRKSRVMSKAKTQPVAVNPMSVVGDSYDSDDQEPLDPPPTVPKLRRETTGFYRSASDFPGDYPPPSLAHIRTGESQITGEPSLSSDESTQSQDAMTQDSLFPNTAELENVCIFCKSNFYTDQAFKTACPDCYDKHKKKCACGRNLPIDAPKYKTQCTSCWIEERKRTHEPCPTCTGAKSLHLRKRKDKSECLDCYRNRKCKDHRPQSSTHRRQRTQMRQNSRERDERRR